MFRCYRCGDLCGDGGRSCIVGRMSDSRMGTAQHRHTDTFINSYNTMNTFFSTAENK